VLKGGTASLIKYVVGDANSRVFEEMVSTMVMRVISEVMGVIKMVLEMNVVRDNAH
jgi:hypothetical protein